MFKAFLTFFLLCLVVLLFSMLVYESNSLEKTRNVVVHLSDGNGDDFVSSVVLASERSTFELKQILYSSGDCLGEYSLASSFKMGDYLSFMFRGVDHGLSRSRHWIQFPMEWRSESIEQLHLPCLSILNEQNVYKPSFSFQGDKNFIRLLEENVNEGVTIIATGPLTTLYDTLREHSSLKKSISSLYWMGGAIDVPGNIGGKFFPSTYTESHAEWNVFSDAFAADWIFKNTEFPIYLSPLDVTNKVKNITFLTNELKRIIKEEDDTSNPRKNRASKYVVDTYDYVLRSFTNMDYYMWDVLTCATFLAPEIFVEPQIMKLKVVTEFENHGEIKRDELSGREVYVFQNFKNKDSMDFLEFVLKVLKNADSEQENFLLESLQKKKKEIINDLETTYV